MELDIVTYLFIYLITFSALFRFLYPFNPEYAIKAILSVL